MDMALSLLVFTALVLLAGAAYLWRRGGAMKQVWLMLVLALVMIVNVAIWTLPNAEGENLLDMSEQIEAGDPSGAQI
ncbi:hypothetical protein [Altericroceibacterium endophyticum]|uniref:Uncharacterized protein n=1 Tax=Altericroceibacterium endophyticum TaxID=1808508 RepID=A0A6I4T1W2_9SPHN|nr:hypothetical protein [Altericroceibacterium endophyticum]MXO64221.1 hypothetical protein [Altericroceibacterium endophyticum]